MVAERDPVGSRDIPLPQAGEGGSTKSSRVRETRPHPELRATFSGKQGEGGPRISEGRLRAILSRFYSPLDFFKNDIAAASHEDPLENRSTCQPRARSQRVAAHVVAMLLGFIVRRTVQLDDHSRGNADKIGDMTAYWYLPPGISRTIPRLRRPRHKIVSASVISPRKRRAWAS